MSRRGLGLALSLLLVAGSASAQVAPPPFPAPPGQQQPAPQPQAMPAAPQPQPPMPQPPAPQPVQQPVPPMPVPPTPIPAMPAPPLPQAVPGVVPPQALPAPPQQAGPLPAPVLAPPDDQTGQGGARALLEVLRRQVALISAGQRVTPPTTPPAGWQRERVQNAPDVAIDRPADWRAQLVANQVQGVTKFVQAQLGSADGRHIVNGQVMLEAPGAPSARYIAEQAAAPYGNLGFVREIQRDDWNAAGVNGMQAIEASFRAYEMRDYVIVSMAIMVTVPQMQALGLNSATTVSKLVIGPKAMFTGYANAVYVPMLNSASW